MTGQQPARRALIVVDVQNDYDGGNLAIAHPPVSESLANITRAMDAAQDHDVKLVVVRQLAPANSPFFANGTHGGELHVSVVEHARDHMIEKTLPSAFTGTDLELYLRRTGIDTVTIAGYMTHNCDLSTIIHAVHMGFEVEFLSDATGALAYANSAGAASAEEIHRVMCVVFQSRFAAVLKTDDWVAHLQNGTRPERDSILASNRRATAGAAA